ncbi:MAG: hypothetical protein Q8K58_11975 [Acidimicrobiales bacterium]|nr:hypothetical protein [Acidimicrobiales bacterium]
METETHTMAGLLAPAGAARLRAASGCQVAPLAAAPAALAQASYGHHQASTWTVGTIAKPATFMVFDRKNRPARHLSELSP